MEQPRAERQGLIHQTRADRVRYADLSGPIRPDFLEARLWTVRRSAEGRPDYFRIADNTLGAGLFDSSEILD